MITRLARCAMSNVESDITIEAILSDSNGSSVRVRAAGWGTEVYLKPSEGLDGDGEIHIELQALINVAKAIGVEITVPEAALGGPTLG